MAKGILNDSAQLHQCSWQVEDLPFCFADRRSGYNPLPHNPTNTRLDTSTTVPDAVVMSETKPHPPPQFLTVAGVCWTNGDDVRLLVLQSPSSHLTSVQCPERASRILQVADW